MNKKVLLIILVFIISFLIIAGVLYFWLFKQKVVLGTAEVKIGETSFSVEVADTMASRAKGLSGREFLGEKNGMLFVFKIPAKYSFWMKGMKFPLDIIWIKDSEIIWIAENVPPATGLFDAKTYFPPDNADMVLELNSGSAKNFNIKIGDRVYINDVVGNR